MTESSDKGKALELPDNCAEFVRGLPEVDVFDRTKRGGIYFLFRADELAYIGSTSDIRSRCKHQLSAYRFANPKIRWLSFPLVTMQDLRDMRDLEAKYIRALRPSLNLCHSGY